MPDGFRGRPTGEIAVLLLTGLVAVVLVVFSVAIVVALFAQPDRDLGTAIGQIMDVLTVILGAVVGYIAGRGTKAAATAHGPDIWDPTEPPQPPFVPPPLPPPPRRADTEQG